MKPIEMIAEWQKGCSIAGPACGQDDSPAECIECTEGLINAMAKAMTEPNPEMLAAAMIAYNNGVVRVEDARNERGYVDYYRPQEAMRLALLAAMGADQ